MDRKVGNCFQRSAVSIQQSGGRAPKQVKMTPAQKEMYMLLDEWWRRYGFGPTIDDVMYVTGRKSRGGVYRTMKALVKLGVCVHTPKSHRSIRPKTIRLRDLE
jgi:SOS-response transcriptional repressor LexA